MVITNSETQVSTNNLSDLKLLSRGKVRDIYELDAKRILIVTTGRQSAHDRVLAEEVPYKGIVLNQLTKFWLEQTKDIIPNHFIECPQDLLRNRQEHNAVIGDLLTSLMIVKRCKPLPIEVVVRAYLAKSSSKTSLFGLYAAGKRDFGDFKLPDGLKPNQKLPQAVLTPTTKSETGDENLSHREIVERGLLTEDLLKAVEDAALRIFARGQEIAATKGLILVDTKYEFGIDENGQLTLIDEVHTPDSSRFWEAATYEERLARGESPQAFDKEGLRDWLTEACGKENLKDSAYKLPAIPDAVMQTHAKKYTDLFNRITGIDLLQGRCEVSQNYQGSQTQGIERK